MPTILETVAWPPTQQEPWRVIDKRVRDHIGYIFSIANKYRLKPTAKLNGSSLTIDLNGGHVNEEKGGKTFTINDHNDLVRTNTQIESLRQLLGERYPEIKAEIANLRASLSPPIGLAPPRGTNQNGAGEQSSGSTTQNPSGQRGSVNDDSPGGKTGDQDTSRPDPNRPSGEGSGPETQKPTDQTGPANGEVEGDNAGDGDAAKRAVAGGPTEEGSGSETENPTDQPGSATGDAPANNPNDGKDQTVSSPRPPEDLPPPVDDTPPPPTARRVRISSSVVRWLVIAEIPLSEAPERLAAALNEKYWAEYTDANEIRLALEEGKTSRAFHKWDNRNYTTPYHDRILRTVNQWLAERGHDPVSIYQFLGIPPQVSKYPINTLADKFWQNCLNVIDDKLLPVKKFEDFGMQPATGMAGFFARIDTAFRVLVSGNLQHSKVLDKICLLLGCDHIDTLMSPKDFQEYLQQKAAGSVPPPPPEPDPPPPPPTQPDVAVNFQKAAEEVFRAYFKLDEFQRTYVFEVNGETSEEIERSLNTARKTRGETLADAKDSYESGKDMLLSAAKSAGAELTLARTIEGLNAGLEVYESDRRRVYIARHLQGDSDERIAESYRGLEADTVRDVRENLFERITTAMRAKWEPAPQ